MDKLPVLACFAGLYLTNTLICIRVEPIQGKLKQTHILQKIK